MSTLGTALAYYVHGSSTLPGNGYRQAVYNALGNGANDSTPLDQVDPGHLAIAITKGENSPKLGQATNNPYAITWGTAKATGLDKKFGATPYTASNGYTYARFGDPQTGLSAATSYLKNYLYPKVGGKVQVASVGNGETISADSEKQDYNVFAHAIKQKYPQYANADNLKLAKAVLQIHPEYANKVSFPDGGGDIKNSGDSAIGFIANPSEPVQTPTASNLPKPVPPQPFPNNIMNAVGGFGTGLIKGIGQDLDATAGTAGDLISRALHLKGAQGSGPTAGKQTAQQQFTPQGGAENVGGVVGRALPLVGGAVAAPAITGAGGTIGLIKKALTTYGTIQAIKHSPLKGLLSLIDL